MWQHNVIRKLARETADDYVDIIKLCTAKERIEAMIIGANKKLRRGGTNTKVARWLNDVEKGRRGSVTYVADVHEVSPES